MSGIPPQGIRQSPTSLQPTQGPAPGLIDTFVAGSRVGVTDSATPKDMMQSGNYFALMEAVGEVNGKSLGDYRPWSQTLNQFVPFSSHLDVYDLDALWSDISEIKKRNPQALAGINNREEFEKGLSYRGPKADSDRDAASRGNVVASFLGQAFGGMIDPINILGTGVGAKTLRGAIGLAMLEGGSLELAQEGLKRKQAKMAGAERTVADAFSDAGIAAVGSGFFAGVGRYGYDNWDAIKAAPKAVQEKLWAQIAPALPESIRPKMDWDAIGDDMLPDIAEAVIGRDNLSEAEADAVAVVRRESAIEARNPFKPDGAGTRVHAENLAEAMQRIFDAPTPSGFGAQARAAVSRGNRETLNRSTSISSGVVPGDARSVLKSRIKVVESSGSNVARNPNSTALGPYQFLTGTWSRLYKSRYGASGKSDAEIAALRTDPRLNEILMDDLMALNEQSLRSAGITPNAGNLYLAHFAGNSGARKLHRVPPNTPVRDVLGDAVVEANPFLQGMNAADVIDWAARKMGGQGGVPSSGRSVDIDPEASVRADLDRQRAQIDADRAAIEGIAPRPRLMDDDDMLPEPIHDGGDIPVLANPIEAIARPAPIASPAVPPRLPTIEDAEVSAFLPKLRKIVRAREMSLNEPAKMAAALGVDEALLRRGLIQMAAGKEIRMNKKQQFMRLPQDSGPVDVLKYIARAGGIKDSEGHDLTGMFRVVQTRSRKVGKGALMEVRRHKVDTTYLVPGAGYIVSDKGRSVDEIGELLWEAGYINNGGDRPTEREVLDMLDSAFRGGKKFYPVDEVATARIKTGKLFRSEEEEYYIRNMFDDVAQANGYSMDDAGNAGARGADAPYAGGQSRADRQDELARATARSFDARLVGLDDPTSPQSRAVIDGMIHDLEMIAVLDADVTFRISDDGPDQSIADALNDLRAKQSEIDALKACMLPKGNG
jgi:hypothetical protein